MTSVVVGDSIGTLSLPITLQRLVMEAGANRDFSLIHHDREVAQATGAPDAYMNTFFIAGMFERLLREWAGDSGVLNSIRQLRMQVFNPVGTTASFSGVITAWDEDTRRATVDLRCAADGQETVTAVAVVTIPA